MITRQLHLGNTWWGVALPQAAFALPVTIIILRPFLMAIPNELEEAALHRRRLPHPGSSGGSSSRSPGPGW